MITRLADFQLLYSAFFHLSSKNLFCTNLKMQYFGSDAGSNLQSNL